MNQEMMRGEMERKKRNFTVSMYIMPNKRMFGIVITSHEQSTHRFACHIRQATEDCQQPKNSDHGWSIGCMKVIKAIVVL